jgi:hypothetical protein
MARELKAEEAKAEGARSPRSKEGVPIEATGIVFGAIMKSVSEGVATACQGTEKTGVTVFEAVSLIVRSALRGATGAGSDFIMGTKAIMMGVIWGTGEKESAALKLLSHAARSVVRQTAVMHGDVGDAVTGLVRGAIAGADRIGVEPAKAAWAVSGAAIEEAYRISSVAADRVRRALRQNVSGMDAVSREPITR